MAREKKVIDASVVAKWFLNEPDSEKAIQLRTDHLSGNVLLIAPDLVFSEVLNALRYKGYGKNALEKTNTALWDIQLHIERTNPFFLQHAIRMALQHNLSIYDALYAALAQMHGCPLVTADEKLSKLPFAVKL